jgi:hypothetical protein
MFTRTFFYWNDLQKYWLFLLNHSVYVRISHYFRCKLKSSQHGFIKLKSATKNLQTYLVLMSPSDSSHSQVDFTHLELRCAFDLEPHSFLPHKVCVCVCVSGFSDGYVNRSRRYRTSRQATVYVLGILTSHFEACECHTRTRSENPCLSCTSWYNLHLA